MVRLHALALALALALVVASAPLAAGCGDDGAPAASDGAILDASVDDGASADLAAADLGQLYTGSFPARSLGFVKATLSVRGKGREVQLYFPQKVVANPPLLIACHGTGGTGEDGVWDIAANELADNEGVIVAAPQARSMPAGDWDQHQAGDVYFETHPSLALAQNADLQLVAAIIAEAQRAYGVDRRRVYIAGFSNGAFFAQFAALRLRDRVAAFASSAGGLVRCDDTSDCSFTGSGQSCEALAKQPGWCACSGAEKPGPIPESGRKPGAYIVHAADDGTVSPYYSCQLFERLEGLGYDVSFTLRQSGSHSSPPSMMVEAWPFLSKHTLP